MLGHSVADLAAECGNLDSEFRALKPRAAPLDHYDVPTRYRNSLPGGIPAEAFDESDARRALGLAAEVIAAVKAKLGRRTYERPVCMPLGQGGQEAWLASGTFLLGVRRR